MLLPLLIIIAIACFALTAWLLHWRPIDSWKNFHQRWSTWLHAAGLANVAAYAGIWDRMPKPVRGLLPDNVFLAVGVLLWLAGALAVYVNQKGLQDD